AGTLQRATRRYEFKNAIRVIDLGLRLADVEDNNLEAEAVHYGKTDPTQNLLENGATQQEIDFLCPERNRYQGNAGQRADVNAFTSGDVVKWIEAKLQEHGIGKVVPDANTLRQAFRRAAEAACLRQLVKKKQKAIRKRVERMDLPDDLEEQVRKVLVERPG